MTAGSADFKTILVLDDDQQFHKLVVPVLTSRGHRVLSAHTGKEAHEIAEREAIDLAIVDGQLPDITGIEWITQFRSAGNQALLMFVSAYWRDAQSYHTLTKELGVMLVLHKPVLPSVFSAEVDILLGRSPSLENATPPDFEDTLLALRAEYAKELPGRLSELSTLLAQMKAQPDNRFLPQELRGHAHKLRGTARSYGFKEVGDGVGRIEDVIVDMLSGKVTREHCIAVIDDALKMAINVGGTAAAEVETRVARLRGREVPAVAEPAEETAIARILVVDDDAAFLDLVDELARHHQLEVARASNASEALDMACMSEIHAALIDVDLGSRDIAFKLASDLRALPGYSDLPLGFVSGAGHIEKTIEIDNFGECLVFDRPTQSDALSAAVRQLVAIRQASRPCALLIDDDADFLNRTAFVLTHEGMRVRTLEDTSNILEVMQECSPDILLLDVMMPGVSGFDICRMLRTIPRWRDLPIIFLTAFADVDTRIACMRCGGDDYLLKPVVNEELLVRLRMRLERARLLKQRVDHDNVSGLLLRRPFMEQMSGMMSEARRHTWTVAIGLLQVDGGPLSQAVSDSVLSLLGGLLMKRLRVEDLKGRWGETTLICAFRHEELRGVDSMLQRVVQEFSASQKLQNEDSNARHRLVYGLSCYPDDGSTIHELLEAADRRLREQQPISGASA